ncbi:alginate export family protein [Methylotenera sp. N17]|uniref:alginate export family protein n=1 Tax=Methylotenera sp. N17 TaxID=1502761 RepID=UPI00064683B2|nr:alginate export family protein [Methylotenera sp. N17]
MKSNSKCKPSQVLSSQALKLSPVAFAVLLGFASLSFNAMAEEEALPEYTFMDAIKTGKNMTSFRLRYEHVEQDGLQPTNYTNAANTANPTANRELKDADGITLRSLVGWQTAPYQNFSFAVQFINVSKLDDSFNDGTNGFRINGATNQNSKIEYAKIVDPDFTDINQAYIDWTGVKNTRVRLGRQAVNLDNVRFIGDIAFRQVMQVFDGISVFNKTITDTEVFLAHFEEVTQITTVQRGGDVDIANIRYRISPTEFLVGYGYLSNMDELGYGNAWFGAGTLNNNGRANLTADQSNKTFGVRLDGTHPFNPNFRAHYTAEYAKQTDYSGGDKRIDAHYYKLGGGLGWDNFNMRIDQELLSSNDNLYAFQTPYGTNHLFQGWVDKFLATPRSGIKDTFVTATYRYDDFLFFADYHVINSDEDFNTVGGGASRNGNQYGKEWNAAVTYNVNKNIMTKLEYGKFTEDDHYAATPNVANNVAGNRGRVRDTEKLWLTAMYTF